MTENTRKSEEEEGGLVICTKSASINHKIALEPHGWGILHFYHDKLICLACVPLPSSKSFQLGRDGY